MAADPFVSFVVERLGDLLIEEARFLIGVSEQVEEMKKELTRMRCFLKDADARLRGGGDELVNNWIAEIREATYDAEDAIHTFVIKVAFRRRDSGDGILNLLMRYSYHVVKNCIARHKVGVEIESIKTKISNIATNLDRYGIRAITEGESSSSRRETRRLLRQSYAHIQEEDVVGLDDKIKTIVEHLVGEHFRVVSICGMGGLGKTTLAKKLYHRINVRRHFDYFAWAYISQQCKPREVLKKILIQLLSPSKEERDKIEKFEHEEVVEKLDEVFNLKKCLVILDDIWDQDSWNLLSPGFSIMKARDSKILLTTRNKEVAKHVDPQCFLYEPKLLTEEESWELFEKKAFKLRETTEFRSRTEIMKLGKEVVKQCGGLPLAIVVLGGLLSTKHTVTEWQMVHGNIRQHLLKDKIHGDPVMDILALSYHDLPYHLKACFLCLSHLLEDQDICSEKLVHIWMAEGIVSPSSITIGEEVTLFDVGMSYLDDLVNRCMVQVRFTRFSKRIKSCHLHDLMRDLCLSKAQEENFCKVVQISFSDDDLVVGDSASSSLSSSSTSTTRRLAIYHLSQEEGSNTEPTFLRDIITDHHHIRSFLFCSFDEYVDYYRLRRLESFLKRLKSLRVIDLDCRKCSNWPRAIGKVMGLRYLRASGFDHAYLTSNIGSLGSLITLDLRGVTFPNIPDVLWRLKQLRHLYLPDGGWLSNYFCAKLRLDALNKLETLINFNSMDFDVGCFNSLEKLRKVKITRVDLQGLSVICESSIFSTSNGLLRYSSFNIKEDFETEESQSTLRKLLGYHHLHKLHINGSLYGGTWPNQLFPPNLTKLTLMRSKLKDDPMPTLEQLPNLRCLMLLEQCFIGKEMICSAAPNSDTREGGGGYRSKTGFLQLQCLHIQYLCNLEEWTVQEGAMPNLEVLIIDLCPYLKRIPEGLRFITTLKELKYLGEDYKFQHIPALTIAPD